MISLLSRWRTPGCVALTSATILGYSYNSFATSAQPILPAAVKEHIVYIEALQFIPTRFEVGIGDQITWINKDIVPHTVSALDDSWDSNGLALGEQFTMTVTASMAKDYFCRYHPSMIAQVDLLD